jgi:phosphoserine phosphatase
MTLKEHLRSTKSSGKGLVALTLGLAVLTGCERAATTGIVPTAEPVLPSWSDGLTRDALVGFVKDVTTEGGPHYVPPAERIAVFDNDGTLWSEQPMYVQLTFAADRVKALAPEHPEWKDEQPFKGVLEGDLEAVMATGKHGLLELMMASHAGTTTEEFAGIVETWLADAQHPTLARPYTECVYQPMLELLDYLRANGFKTWIVSGGGIEFLRVWAEDAYGIPPEQVVGSSIVTQFEMREGGPVLVRLPEVDFNDDKAGKPVAINKFIGRRPILAFGNSDGDLQMLQWTTSGPGRRLGLIVHHTDDEREVAYDRESHIGRLDQALQEAPEGGWVVVDMKNDWKTIFPAKKPAS